MQINKSFQRLCRIAGAGGIMREINRILCPVDLSDVSRDAIHHAVLLARWYNAKITALGSHALWIDHQPGGAPCNVPGSHATTVRREETLWPRQ